MLPPPPPAINNQQGKSFTKQHVSDASNLQKNESSKLINHQPNQRFFFSSFFFVQNRIIQPNLKIYSQTQDPSCAETPAPPNESNPHLSAAGAGGALKNSGSKFQGALCDIYNTVDGSEARRSPVDTVNIQLGDWEGTVDGSEIRENQFMLVVHPSIYQGFQHHPRWLTGFLNHRHYFSDY